METYTIKISRYNPDADDQATMKDYTVPIMEQGSVLGALQYIYEEVDSTLLFSYGCRYKVCGKCAMKINGRPGLACETDMEDEMVLEPLDNFPVIRDLAVDRSGVFDPLKELDIVLSPVKESEVANQPSEFFEFVTCAECLSCLSVCPVFAVKQQGNGPMFRVKLAELFYDVRDGKERFDQLSTFYDCTTCRSCSSVCPQQISLDEVVFEVRKALLHAGRTPEPMIGVRDSIVSSGNVYASSPQKRMEIYPQAVKEKADAGKLKETADTLLFMGCVSSYLDIKVAPNFLNLLEAAKVDYATLCEEEICCGFPLYLMGSDDFESHAKSLIQRMKATGARQLVTPCAGCFKTFKKLYPQVDDLGMDVYMSFQYIEKLFAEGLLNFSKELKKKITYHDPCDIGRTFGIYEEPRHLLSKIPGATFVEMDRNKEQARCCGGGGNVQAHDQGMAVEMAAARVKDALAVDAEIIVTACPACKSNLRKGARAIPKEERGKIKVMDITEVVTGAMG